MFDVGFMELTLLAIVGMVVIGPERLPVVARTFGRTLGQVRRFMRNLQRQLEQEVKLDENDRPVRGMAPPGTPPSDEVEPPMPEPEKSSPHSSTRDTPSDR